MTVSLTKGQGVSLKKNSSDLSKVTIGLGWDVAETFKLVERVVERKKGGLGGLLGATEKFVETVRLDDVYDLDVCAFLCGLDGKVALGRDPNGRETLIGGDIVFFNSKLHFSGQVVLTGDNRTGAGEGDDEQIEVNLNELPEHYSKIIFLVQIYNGLANQQNFGQVKNAYIRAVDGKGHEMARFDLSGGAGFENCRSLLFAELLREQGGWRFAAVGEPSPADSFREWLKNYR